MNKKLVVSTLFAVASVAATTSVSAHPAYIGPANAVGSCGDCHVGGTRSKQFVPGLIELFPIDQKQPIQNKIKEIFNLTDAQRLPVWKKWDAIINPKSDHPDTAPVVKAGKAYTYTVGGKPLVIPVTVTDKEKDSYALDQSYGDGFTISKAGAFKGSSSSFKIIVDGIAPEYANETWPIELSVKEDQRKKGRNLKSNKITFNLKVLPKAK